MHVPILIVVVVLVFIVTIVFAGHLEDKEFDEYQQQRDAEFEAYKKNRVAFVRDINAEFEKAKRVIRDEAGS